MSLLAPVEDKVTTEAPSDPGDHDKFSHYVKKDKILESALTGLPVQALCGKMWRPNAAPEKFPVCPTCKDEYEKLEWRTE